MAVESNGSVGLQEKLREEAQRLRELVDCLQHRASQTEDTSELGVMERALTSARESIERLVETEEIREWPFDPIAESQEITLPTFPFPGEREKVKCRDGGPRLPDTGPWNFNVSET